MCLESQVPASELRAAVGWEFARERSDLFEPLWRDRDSFVWIDADIEDLQWGESRDATTEQKLQELSAKRRSVPDVLLTHPLSRIWSAPEFPYPWLSLPEARRSQIASAFAADKPSWVRVPRVTEGATHRFTELVEAQRDEWVKLLPPDFDHEDLVRHAPEASFDFAHDGFSESLMLLRIDWRAETGSIMAQIREMLERRRPHDAHSALESAASDAGAARTARSLLKGLALNRFRDKTSGGWHEIDQAMMHVGGERPFKTGARKTQHGSSYFPHYRRAEQKAKDFREQLLSPAGGLKFLLPH